MSKLLNELSQQKQQIEALCLKYGARRIRVFGSVARGEESQDSDIDLLVDAGLLCFLSEQGLPDSGFYLVPGKDRLSRAALRFEAWLLTQ